MEKSKRALRKAKSNYNLETMAAFTDDEIVFSRIDVWALVSQSGLATVDEPRRDPCLTWLRHKGYQIEQLNCKDGIKPLQQALGKRLRWEEEFGYRLEDGRGILDALRDGFEFEVPSSGGLVLELFRSDVVWREDDYWLLGLLSIASQHSQRHLACGRRFFTLQVLPENSPLFGQKIEELVVPFFHPNFFSFQT